MLSCYFNLVDMPLFLTSLEFMFVHFFACAFRVRADLPNFERRRSYAADASIPHSRAVCAEGHSEQRRGNRAGKRRHSSDHVHQRFRAQTGSRGRQKERRR